MFNTLHMSNAKERIKQYIEYLGISTSEFERTAGLGNGSMSKPTARMQSSTIRSIGEAYTDLNTDWVKTGRGEMIKPNPSNSIRDISNNSGLINQGDHPTIFKDVKIMIEEEIGASNENIRTIDDAQKRIKRLKELLREAENKIIKLEGKIEQQNETIKLLAGK